MADVIPFDQRDGSLWYDGRLVPWKDAKTHVLTHGLHYGSCVFEGQRIYGGTVYKLKEHTARLFFSAETLGMKIPYTQDQISQACIEAAAAQDIKSGFAGTLFKGADGQVLPFTKRFKDPAIAVQTQFTVAEAYFELAKRHRDL